MVNLKSRVYDQDGFIMRAASVCVRGDNENEILLITSQKSYNDWIIPGGGIEPNECCYEAAIRETLEEAGVEGSIKRFLGVFEDASDLKKSRTLVFVIEAKHELATWPECQKRCRRWFKVDEALNRLLHNKPKQCAYIEAMVKTSLSSFDDLLKNKNGLRINRK